jgi:hypothetical protein
MDDWITAVQTETRKAAKLQTFNQPGAKKYAWVQVSLASGIRLACMPHGLG